MIFSDMENCISSGVLRVGRCRLRHRVDRSVNDVPQERRRPMVALSFPEVKTRAQPRRDRAGSASQPPRSLRQTL